MLIARVFPGHPHAEHAHTWTGENPNFAVCPIVEGALVRHCLRTADNGAMTAIQSLEMLRGLPGYEFWPDDLSYGSMALHRLRGHGQATDAYLVALAAHHGGRLATFDRALVALHPEAILVPT